MYSCCLSPSLALNSAWNLLLASRRMAGAHPFVPLPHDMSRNRTRNGLRQSYGTEPALCPNEEHDCISHGRRMGEQSAAEVSKQTGRRCIQNNSSIEGEREKE